MKRKLNLLMAALFFVSLYSCTKNTLEENPPPDKENSIPAPSGWKYFGGDEFNADTLNAMWMAYGTPGSGTASYGRPQGMIQTYRPQQVTLEILATGEKVVRLTSVKRTDGDVQHGQTGWWSGAIATREKNVFFPLFSRIDVKAKVVNELGIWHAIWSRFYKGASTAELDLLEFFVKESGKGVAAQAIHLWSNITNTTKYNLPPGQDRRENVANPANTFHVYSVQIEEDPTDGNQAIITMLVDNVVNYSFHTKTLPEYNKFITDAKSENRTNNAWDVVITGQIGASSASVGYPEEGVNTAITEIDYVRIFVKK